MDFANDWQALLQPGKARSYFTIPHPERMQPDASGYSKVNAWWLAELSRLIYRPDRDEMEAKLQGLGRRNIIEKVQLQEFRFFNTDGVRCAVIGPQAATQGNFAVLVFRGTHKLKDWLTNIDTFPARWSEGGLVHGGFKKAFCKVWNEVDEYLTTMQVPLFYTGHSLGAAFATLAASKRPPHALYTFGSPRVGNVRFAQTLKDIEIYRVVNHRDVITTVPPSWKPLSFRHVGQLHYIAHNNRLLVEPSEETVGIESAKIGLYGSNPANTRRWFAPPEYLADHAPINYVAHLERHM